MESGLNDKWGERTELLLTALGNPNVDMTIKVNDTYFFDKYNLIYDGQLPVTQDVLNEIKDDIKKRNHEIEFSPGGCSQNTLRIFQWLWKSQFQSAIIGSTGTDEEALYLEKELRNAGVKTLYTKLPDYRTATVIIMAYRGTRTAVYGLDKIAASKYCVNFLQDIGAIPHIRDSKIVLVEGFFTVHSSDVGLEVCRICEKNNILTSFNLCGEYVIKKNKDSVIPFAKKCNIVIGNKVEFSALAETLKINNSSYEECLRSVFAVLDKDTHVSTNYKVKSMNVHNKILIVTNGSDPVFCVSKSGVIEVKPARVEEDKIKDSTAAGDSFLAGFLSGLLRELPLKKCIEIGCKVSAEIIQYHGCVVPNKDPAEIIS